MKPWQKFAILFSAIVLVASGSTLIVISVPTARIELPLSLLAIGYFLYGVIALIMGALVLIHAFLNRE